MFEGLSTLTAGRTSITIAHRLAMVRNADRTSGAIFPATSKSPQLPEISTHPAAETHESRVARRLPLSGAEPFCKGP